MRTATSPSDPTAEFHGTRRLPSLAGPSQRAGRRMSRSVWNLGDGPEQLSYAATSLFEL